MGLIICPTHGSQVITFTSPLIWQKILDKEPMENAELAKITMVFFDDPATYIVDQQYLETYNLRGIEKFVFDENSQDHLDFMENLKAICPKCLNQFLEDNKFPGSQKK